MGPGAKEYQQPLGPGKGNGMEMDSPLQSPEGTQPSQHLDCSPVRPCWTSELQKCKKRICAVLLFVGFQLYGCVELCKIKVYSKVI